MFERKIKARHWPRSILKGHLQRECAQDGVRQIEGGSVEENARKRINVMKLGSCTYGVWVVATGVVTTTVGGTSTMVVF